MDAALLMVVETVLASGPFLAAIFVAGLGLAAALVAATVGSVADPEPFPAPPERSAVRPGDRPVDDPNRQQTCPVRDRTCRNELPTHSADAAAGVASARTRCGKDRRTPRKKSSSVAYHTGSPIRVNSVDVVSPPITAIANEST